MRFVFTKRFYLLLGVGLIPLSFAWAHPWLKWVTLTYDFLLLIVAIVDARMSRLSQGVSIVRTFAGRFAVGGEMDVRIEIENNTPHRLSLRVKDEYPPAMVLTGPREAALHIGAQRSVQLLYKLKPPRRGRFEFGRIAVRFVSRLGLVWCETKAAEPQFVKVYPNMRRA